VDEDGEGEGEWDGREVELDEGVVERRRGVGGGGGGVSGIEGVVGAIEGCHCIEQIVGRTYRH